MKPASHRRFSPYCPYVATKPIARLAWGLSLAVLQPPVLRVPAGLLKDALRSEVEGRTLLVRGIDPVDRVLPVLILVVAEAILVVPDR